VCEVLAFVDFVQLEFYASSDIDCSLKTVKVGQYKQILIV